MELSRRDALAALAAAGVTVGSGAVVGDLVDRGAPRADDEGSVDAVDAGSADVDVLATLSAAAEVLYPSEVEGHREFVETYVLGRIQGREDYRTRLVTAVEELDAVAVDWHGTHYADLEYETRDQLLSSLGLTTAEPDPEGPLSDRLRFYVVDDLLYAFYTSPAGGELVGTENPVGYPGGIESYQRGPQASGPAEEEN